MTGYDYERELATVRHNTRDRADRAWDKVSRRLYLDGMADRQILGIPKPDPFAGFKALGKAFANLGKPRAQNIRDTVVELTARREELLAMRAKLEQDDALSAILAAWNDAGTHPHYHRQQQARLRRSWPVLGRALDQLTEAHTGSTRTNRERSTR